MSDLSPLTMQFASLLLSLLSPAAASDFSCCLTSNVAVLHHEHHRPHIGPEGV